MKRSKARRGEIRGRSASTPTTRGNSGLRRKLQCHCALLITSSAISYLQTTDITIKRREETVRRKRLRRATSAASLGPQSEGEGTVVGEEPRLQAEAQEQEQILVLPTPEDIEVQVRNAVEAMNSAPVGSNAHLNAVRGLRELLSSCKIQLVIFLSSKFYYWLYLA